MRSRQTYSNRNIVKTYIHTYHKHLNRKLKIKWTGKPTSLENARMKKKNTWNQKFQLRTVHKTRQFYFCFFFSFSFCSTKNISLYYRVCRLLYEKFQSITMTLRQLFEQSKKNVKQHTLCHSWKFAINLLTASINICIRGIFEVWAIFHSAVAYIVFNFVLSTQ